MDGRIQLAHVELLTPAPEESRRFFCELLGMQLTEAIGDSAYLRGYEEAYHHSLKLTISEQPGIGHVGLRVQSPEMLQRVAAGLAAAGHGEWAAGDAGHGDAFVVTAPSGHVFEFFHEVTYHEVPDELRSQVLNRPQRRPLQGVPVRRIDHVSLMAADVAALVEWLTGHTPFEVRERVVRGDGRPLGAWLSASSLMHDIALVADDTAVSGRLHHLGFWYGAPQHLWDVADHCVDHGIAIEHGPGKHGATQAMYLYVREPGGNRIELFGDVGQLVFDPTWPVVTWIEDGAPTARSSWIGNPPPPGFFTYATPQADAQEPSGLPAPLVAGWLR